MLTAINNAIVIDKKVSQIHKFFISQIICFFITICWNSCFSSIISSHINTKSSITLAKYLPFSQMHLKGFQI